MEQDLGRLGRPPPFDGAESQWADWSFQMRAYLSLLDTSIGPGLDAAEAEERNLDMNAFNEAAKAASRKIYYILTMTLRGPPLGILKSTPQQNGYLSWRTLFTRYEGSSAGRQHSLLSRILKPKTFREHPLEWEDDLTSWELDVSRWETASMELLSENVKNQSILDQSPSTWTWTTPSS